MENPVNQKKMKKKKNVLVDKIVRTHAGMPQEIFV